MFGKTWSIVAVTALAFDLRVAALATYEPGPSFSIGIPSGSEISSSAAGSIYIQMSAPSTYQWVGFGIGTEMKGSTIFLMYTDGSGNVTVSVRDGGQGHVEPTLDTSLTSSVTLLEGSGVVGSNIVANILCTACKLESDATSTSSPWIAAWNMGSAIDSTSTSYSISQHSSSNTRQVNIDLSSASTSSTGNPFSASSGSSSASGTATATGTETGASSSPSGSSSSSSGGDDITSSASFAKKIKDKNDWDKSHGVLSAVSVVLLFPMGAFLFRLGGSWWVHALIQIISLAALIAGLYFGVKVANLTQDLFNCTHTILGIVVIALFVVQPLFGFAHHVRFKATGGRTAFSYIHIWVGRIVMLLGIINGGLGLQLADNSSSGNIAYGVVAAVVVVTYCVLLFVQQQRRKRGGGVAMKEKQPSEAGGEVPVRMSSQS